MSLHPISLEEFAVDPQLGGFAEASPAQRLVLRLLDGLPPADVEQHNIFAKLAAREWGPDLSTIRRTIALLAGVDSGKSLLSALLSVHRALFSPLAGLRPGQRPIALLIAPDTRTATIPLGYASGILRSAPLASEVESETSDTIRLARGVDIQILPAGLGARTIRGRRFVSVVMEEAAFFRDQQTGRVNDRDIYRAALPRVLPGGQLFAISTPWRRGGSCTSCTGGSTADRSGRLSFRARHGCSVPTRTPGSWMKPTGTIPTRPVSSMRPSSRRTSPVCSRRRSWRRRSTGTSPGGTRSPASTMRPRSIPPA